MRHKAIRIIHKAFIDENNLEALAYICDIIIDDNDTGFEVTILSTRPTKIIGHNGEITRLLAQRLRSGFMKMGNVTVRQNALWNGLG